MTVTEIRQILEAPYDRKVWKNFIQTQFTNNQLAKDDYSLQLGKSDIYTECYALGHYAVDDYTRIGVFEVQLAAKVNLNRNRVALRTLVKDITQQVAGAMVVFVQGEKWRFSYISKRKVKNAETNTIVDRETAPKRYTYLFGKGEKALTAAQRFDRLIQKQQSTLYRFLSLNDFEEAFSVEKLSKDFFRSYKEVYEDFVEFLTGKRFIRKGSKWTEIKTHDAQFQLRNYFDNNETAARDFFKRMMGRIVFLYFIQKKGWLAVPRGKQWGEGNLDYMYQLFHQAKYKDSFYSDYLVPLFFDTLNNPASQNEKNELRFPYLNGGLFDKSQDYRYDKIALPAELFEKLFETFNNFNFTVYEDAPDEHTVAVDPEMLGHIFENLLEDNKDKGAFYTPKDIVHYMCRESLHNYIYTYTGNEDNEDFKQRLRQYNEYYDIDVLSKEEIKQIDRALEDVKICDPAIGSGAFPMGLLHEIYHLKIPIEDAKGFKAKSPADLKKHIIEESIYGVDIESGAVDIARLRFWLSLVVEESIPQPLPNLSFKIVCANTLIPLGMDNTIQIAGATDIIKQIEKVRHDYFDASKDEKRDLERLFKSLQNKLWATAKDWVTTKDAALYQKLLEFNPFEDNSCSWFDPLWMFGVKDGFDIVIGNPPYIKEATNKAAFTEFKKSIYYQGKMDLWYGFACIMLDNLKKNTGILTFIATNNWVTNAGASKFRNKIVEDAQILQLIDFGNYKIFESADIQTMVMIFKANQKSQSYRFDYKKVIDTEVTLEDIATLLEGGETEQTQILTPAFERKALKDKTFVFSQTDIEVILNVIQRKSNYRIDGATEITSGIDVLQDFLSKEAAERLGGNVQAGQGVFILNDDDIKDLNPSPEEWKLLRPYYTTENLQRFYGNSKNKYWIIYTDSSFKDATKIKAYPNLKRHLDKFLPILTSDNKPYGLHRARNSYFFEGEKIFSQRKCAIPTFTYADFDCYVSRAFMIIKSSRVDPKYLTALLNSKLCAFWLKHKGKMQGFQFQIDKSPLIELPLITSVDQNLFASIVDYIIFLKANVKNRINEYVSNEHILQSFEELSNACVYELYFGEHMKEKEIDVLCFAKDLVRPLNNEDDSINVNGNIINAVYSKMKEPDNEIRNRMRLFATRSENILLPIQRIY